MNGRAAFAPDAMTGQKRVIAPCESRSHHV